MVALADGMHFKTLLGLLGALTVAVPAAAQEEMCDPSLPRFADHQHGYRDWGDRCEGIYAETPVRGTTITVASFTRGPIRYDLVNEPVTITWPDDLDLPVRLRARPLRPDLFYQMDTVQPADESSWQWPATFLSLYQIMPRDLALLGWVTMTIDQKQERVHLPLSVGQDGRGNEAENYELLVVPGLELAELSIAIDQSDLGGKVQAAVLEETALGYGYYPAESGLPITLPDLVEGGLYHVKLVAERKRDGIERSEQFWFYHPGD